MSTDPARRAATIAIARAAESFPDIPVETFDPIEYGVKDRRDIALAVVIHRTVMQRWLTLRHLLSEYLKQRFDDLEPRMQAVLLAGAAQVVFMDRMPVHAVVDESVKLAKQLVRPKAAGMVNAVLRRVGEHVVRIAPDEPYEPAENRLPLNGGSVILDRSLGWPPERLLKHFSIACSCPPTLLARWEHEYGSEAAKELAIHSVTVPPTLVAVEPGFSSDGKDTLPHEAENYVKWTAGRRDLAAFLEGHPARRVQDPTASMAVRSAAHLEPKTILDYCAGRGTKTKQLSQQFPEARIFATDGNPNHRAELRRQFADAVTICSIGQLADHLPEGGVDLLLLDLPCSNTGTLARRAEARYRVSTELIERLVAVQRDIVQKAWRYLAPGGHLLYSTCSIDAAENREQIDWLIKHFPAEPADTPALILPGGRGETYHDGGFHALVRRVPR